MISKFTSLLFLKGIVLYNLRFFNLLDWFIRRKVGFLFFFCLLLPKWRSFSVIRTWFLQNWLFFLLDVEIAHHCIQWSILCILLRLPLRLLHSPTLPNHAVVLWPPSSTLQGCWNSPTHQTLVQQIDTLPYGCLGSGSIRFLISDEANSAQPHHDIQYFILFFQHPISIPLKTPLKSHDQPTEISICLHYWLLYVWLLVGLWVYAIQFIDPRPSIVAH